MITFDLSFYISYQNKVYDNRNLFRERVLKLKNWLKLNIVVDNISFLKNQIAKNNFVNESLNFL
jgi:hypothetical protein